MCRIEYSPNAVEHLKALTVRQQRLLVDAADNQFKFEPLTQTRNRKQMCPNAMAPRELRVAEFRVYNDVREKPDRAVLIRATGRKLRNRVFIGGVEFVL